MNCLLEKEMSVIKLEYLPHYTYDDYCQWDGNWELIYGIPYAMSPSATIKHQNVSGKIHIELDKKLKKCLTCDAVLAIDWKLNDETVLCPDNVVVCDLDNTKAFISQVPQIVFEVLSPSTKKKDRIQKYEIYQEQGIKYYIMIDPLNDRVEVYELNEGIYHLVLETIDSGFDFDLGRCQFNFDFSKI